MKYLPGSEKIVEENLELFSLANALFVSQEKQGHFVTHPYIEKSLRKNGKRLIIEKLLSVAIKMRFLDDQCNLLKEFDRGNSGLLVSEESETEVGLREAFNKIIHHKSITIHAGPTRTTVSSNHGSQVKSGLQVAEGVYEGFSIYIRAVGMKNKSEWVFNSELIHLTNEVFRVISQSSDEQDMGNTT